LNPVIALDQPSIGIIDRLNSDLIHINRQTQQTEPALAKSWKASRDGTEFTVKLRRGLKFSDGQPFDADDVMFSFKVYLDNRVPSRHHDLLTIKGKPIKLEKLDPYTVRFTFPAPYAAAERAFDSVAMLPRHLMEKDFEKGTIGQMWGLNVAPDKIAGMGAFRLKQVVPGQKIVLERNPYYWKVDSKGHRLPYLDELTILIVPSQEAQLVRFQAGDTQVISDLSGEDYAALQPEQQARHFKLYDAGPGLEYNFLLFNLNDDIDSRLPQIAQKQRWFRDERFRQAVSSAIDRAAIVRLVYRGRGAPLATHVSPGNKRWFDTQIPAPVQSQSKARQLLKSAGFSWKPDGTLVDSTGQPVEFSILAKTSSAPRMQMATMIQDDLKQIGITAHVVSMESGAVNDRLLRSHDYEAAILALVSSDADPTPDMNVLMSNGQTHLWHLDEKTPATPWEAEIDRLLEQQQITLNYEKRRKLYDQLQELLAREEPVIFLVTPDILVGARENLGNFRPAIIEQYTLWNADELFWRTPAGKY
jgi:peptide/nickel transport system substrate-binding protein